MSVLWPESDTERARALLRDSLYRLRESLGEGAVTTTGDEIGLDFAHVSCDVCEFEDATKNEDLTRAISLYGGPFLDAFFLDGSAEFERWMDAERSRLAGSHAGALESLAAHCADRGDLLGAVALWRRRSSEDPYNSRVALKLITTLDSAGDRAGALHHGANYTILMRTDFGAPPDAAITEAIARIRGDPAKHDRSVLRPPTHPAPMQIAAGIPPVLREVRLASVQSPSGRQKIQAFGRSLYTGIPLVVTLTMAVGGLRWYSATHSTRAVESDLVAVLPFRVTAPDSSHNYLREGIVDLVGAQLSGSGLPHAIDTRTMDAGYKRAVRDAGGSGLTLSQEISLAGSLGANQMMTGELVLTPTASSLSARLVSVSSGRVLAEYSERGGKDELALIGRVTQRLLAKRFGEALTRISRLSDSTEAVKAYLSGMRASREWKPKLAFNEFSRALDIDPSFAAAALWRAYTSWGAFMFGTPQKLMADSVAWSLRQRVGRRDSLILASLPSIGPKWPQPFNALELLNALENAANANSDRPEVWQSLARHMEAFGRQAGISDHLARAAAADDSAIALDSSFTPAIGHRMYVAVLQGDTTTVRRLRPLIAAITDSARRAMAEWDVARSLHETARVPRLVDRVALTENGVSNITLGAVFYQNSSLDESDRAASLRYAHFKRAPNSRTLFMSQMFVTSALRGQPKRALAFLDSAGMRHCSVKRSARRQPECLADTGIDDTGRLDPFYRTVIILSITEPGYDSVALKAVRALQAEADTTDNQASIINDLCFVHLWRVTRGDTLGARSAGDRMRRLASNLGPAANWNAGRLGLCSSLIGAAVERQAKPGVRSAALARTESLLMHGILTEAPGNVAHLLVARWLEADGKYEAARTILRHIDPMSYIQTGPESWRMIGSLSERLGDNTAAIDAYQRFLTLRTNPEPGSYADQMREVRKRLALLDGKEVEQYHVFKN